MTTIVNNLNDPNRTQQSGQPQQVVRPETHFSQLLQSIGQKRENSEVVKPAEMTEPQGSPEERIRSAVQQAAQKYNLPPALIFAFIKQESGFKPNAKSWCGAQGLMQLMPGTAKDLGVKDAWNIEQNIEGGSKYIRQMLDQFGGDLKKAIAAYNAGPGAVQRYGGTPPFKETQQYVPAVMAHYEKFNGGPVNFTIPSDYRVTRTFDYDLAIKVVDSSEVMTQMATSAAIASNIQPIDLPKPSKSDEPPPPPPPSAVRV